MERVIGLHDVSLEMLSDIQDFLQEHAGRTTYHAKTMDYEFSSGNYAVYDWDKKTLTIAGEYEDSIDFIADAVESFRQRS